MGWDGYYTQTGIAAQAKSSRRIQAAEAMGCTQPCSSGELSERSMTLAHVLLTGLDLALPEIYLPLGS
jgi:hypothetical protein